MFINNWYVAAQSEDLEDTPLKVTMLGCDFALYRTPEGKAACISNVCPHRGASMADGKCKDDGTLACPYHGWQFNVAGDCTLIPSRREQDPQALAPGVKIDAYLTEEKYGLIWVFLGDDPDSAAPIPDIPEFEDDAFVHTRAVDEWQANYHWAKFSNLDLVHLPVVHGIQFQNQENPFEPPPAELKREGLGFNHLYYPSAGIREGGEWDKLREDGEAKQVESYMKFSVAGWMLHGRVEIGGVGSGMHNAFYEFSTPIDDTRTMMTYIFFRNFMTEPEINPEHLKRNMMNVKQDKAIAEAQRPKIAPHAKDPHGLYTADEDTVIALYWDIMEEMRAKGWQIDRLTLAEQNKDARYRVIPSPKRQQEKGPWVHPEVPRFPKTI